MEGVSQMGDHAACYGGVIRDDTSLTLWLHWDSKKPGLPSLNKELPWSMISSSPSVTFVNCRCLNYDARVGLGDGPSLCSPNICQVSCDAVWEARSLWEITHHSSSISLQGECEQPRPSYRPHAGAPRYGSPAPLTPSDLSWRREQS